MQYKWVALSVTTVGVLMFGLDMRIVVVGLPVIAREMGVDIEGVIWISQAYLLASTLGLLLIGRVADLFGRVKLYKIGFAIFTIGSALSSISFSAAQLIVSRIVQGIGSSMMFVNSTAILTDAASKDDLGTLLGLNQIAVRIGGVLGLTLSGVILSLTDWRALFYINIPIGIFGTLWAHFRLREVSTRDEARKIDWAGFGIFAAGLAMILLAITFLSYGLSDTKIGIALAILGTVLMIVFVLIETRTDSPILDLRLLKIREFAGANIANFLNGLTWSGLLVMLSFYLQITQHMTPLQTGISILPFEATFLIVGLISGKLSDRYGTRVFSTAGLIATSLGMILLVFATNNSSSYFQIALALEAVGAGQGLFVAPIISSIMGSVPPDRRGIGSAFQSTLYNVSQTASQGLVILLITLGIPYGAFSSLANNLISQNLVGVATEEFVDGFKIAALVLALVNGIAIVPSLLRGGRKVREGAEQGFDDKQPRHSDN